MNWKVLITASGFVKGGPRAEELMRRAGCELVIPPRLGPLRAKEVVPLLEGIDAVLASLDQYSAEVLTSSQAGRLKIIARWGVGYDSIDVAAATRNGIAVTFTPGLLDEAVADYAFALLLTVARRTHETHATLSRHAWKPLWGHDVAGKALGLIGCGRIALAMARRAKGFDMRLLAYDPKPNLEAATLGIETVSLDTVLRESDFVSLHAASTPQNRGLLGETQLRTMKPTAYLINTARGALVDEVALAAALRGGRIAGAALDVFETEPLPDNNPLRDAPNLLLSPHQASFTYETGERVSLAAAQAILDLINGRKPQNVLNPEVFESPKLRAKCD
jgi:phosphoglycerate dehydrogenase-like enzyme